MNDGTKSDNLTNIPTRPELLADGTGEGELAIQARQELVMIYYGAAYRYLSACLQDAATAEDLAQHFASRMMEGNYIKQADLGQGRFRDYLKRSLLNLVSDYRKKTNQQKRVRSLPDEAHASVTVEQQEYESDKIFLNSVREELVSCAWKALAALERDSDTPYESVLRLKTEQPKLRSAQIAEQLSAKLGKPLTETGVRQILKRGREKFSNFLLDHVEKLLQTSDPESVEQFLIELELLDLCKDELSQRRR